MIKGVILSLFIVLAFAFAITPNKKPYFVGLTIVKPAMSEYVNTYLYSDSNVYAFIFTGTVKFQPFNFSGNKIKDVAPGFNQFIALDASGFVWTADLGSVNGVKKTVDTFGNSFNNNRAVYGYFYSYFTISNDSSIIWTWGNGSYNWFATPIVKPYPLHAPAGKKWVKLSGGNDLVGLTSTGEIWQWNNGDTNAVQKTIPAGSYAVDIAASHNAFYLAVVHNYSGGNANLGKLYWWGSQPGYVGDNSSITQPTALTGIFTDSVGGALPYNVKNVVVNDNTVHFLDSANNCWGEGDGAQGEVGQGRDTVLKYQYSNQYAWTTLKGEGYTNGKCYIVIPNVKELFTGTSFTFYCMIKMMNDSLAFWGRNKSFVLPTRYVSNTESTKPNALDVVRATVGSGFQNPNGVSVNFVAPTMSAGGNQSVTTNNPTLSVSGSPTQMGAYGYSFFSYQWSQVSGATAVINSPTSSTTTVTMPSAGTYRFRMTTTDTQTATDTASVQIIYNPPAGGCGGCSVQNRIRNYKRV
jgi:hypothetical protein